MSFESKEHYWVIVFEPSEANCHFSADTRLYWGTKKGGAAWTDDLAQATHFKTRGGARSNMADRNSKYRRPVWHGVVCRRYRCQDCNADYFVVAEPVLV